MYIIYIVMEDDQDNVTRFLMLAREPIMPRIGKSFKVICFLIFFFPFFCRLPCILLLLFSVCFQTSIVFSLEEGPGVLFKALAVFAMRDINLTKVQNILFILLFFSYLI
jgi:arogenate/prephenate dehydratase